MAVIKVFDSLGVKTVELMGNLEDQPYDEDELATDIAEETDETDDGF